MKRDEKEEVGKRIKEQMDKQNLSFRDVCRDMKITGPTMEKWLNGIHLPSTKLLPDLARCLDCSLDFLFGLEKGGIKVGKKGEKYFCPKCDCTIYFGNRYCHVCGVKFEWLKRNDGNKDS
ncbi:MAG: helix-turn-helix transcriptional regulator [Eubacteriales bacterium]